MIKRISALIGAFLYILLPGIAFADCWYSNPVYHTYGNTAAYTGDAFLQLAHVMSGTGFRAMFISFTLLGIAIGGIFSVFSQFKGMHFSAGPLIQWGFTVVIGVGLYMSYIVPTTDMTFYDNTGDAMALAPEVPDGVVNIAMTMNWLETGMINIMDIGITGLHYEDMAGGISYQLISKLFTGQLNTTVLPSNMRQSITNYYNDCVVFEGTRPGGTIKPKDFTDAKTTSLKPVFAMAALNGVLTTYVDSTGASHSISCHDAWVGTGGLVNGLNNDLDTNLSDRYIADQCVSMGFEEAGGVTSRVAGLGGEVNNITTCRSISRRVFSALMSDTASDTAIGDMWNYVAWNRVMMQGMYDAVASGDAGSVVKLTGNNQIMSSGIGMGIMASEWMPVIRTMVLSVFLGIIPFILVFLPTPFLSKVLSFLCGGLMFIAAWGVCDAVLTQLTVQYAFTNLSSIKADGINYINMLQVPDHLAKIMGMLGYLRTSAIMFAALITTMMFKFGGHALSSLAGSIAGTVQSAGAAGGAAGLTPQGMASTVASSVQVPASVTAYRDTINASGGYNNTVSGMSTVQSVGMMQSMGGARGTMAAQGTLQNVGHVSDNNSFMQASSAEGNSIAVDRAGRGEFHDSLKKKGYSSGSMAFAEGDQFENLGEAWDTGEVVGRTASAKSVHAAKVVNQNARGRGQSVGGYLDDTVGTTAEFNTGRELKSGEELNNLDRNTPGSVRGISRKVGAKDAGSMIGSGEFSSEGAAFKAGYTDSALSATTSEGGSKAVQMKADENIKKTHGASSGGPDVVSAALQDPVAATAASKSGDDPVAKNAAQNKVGPGHGTSGSGTGGDLHTSNPVASGAPITDPVATAAASKSDGDPVAKGAAAGSVKSAVSEARGSVSHGTTMTDVIVGTGMSLGIESMAEKLGSAGELERDAGKGGVSAKAYTTGTKSGALQMGQKLGTAHRFHSEEEAGHSGGISGAKTGEAMKTESDIYGTESNVSGYMRKKVTLQVKKDIAIADDIGGVGAHAALGTQLGNSDASDMISTGESFENRTKANGGFGRITAKKTAQKELDTQRNLDTSGSIIEAFDGIDSAAEASAKSATLSATTSFNQTLANDMGLAASKGDKEGVKSALGHMAVNVNSGNSAMAEGAIVAASNIRGSNSRESAKLMAEAFNEALSTHLTGDDMYGNSSLSFGKEGGHLDLVSGSADSQLNNKRASFKKLQSGESGVVAQTTTKDASTGQMMTVSNTGGESTQISINHTVVDGGYQNRAPISSSFETISHSAKEHYGEDSWQGKAADFVNMTWGDVKGVAGEVSIIKHAVRSNPRAKGAKKESSKPTPPSSGPADGYHNAPSAPEHPSDYYLP